MKTNQKGFSVVEILVVIVVVGLIGGVGWYVWQSRNGDTAQTASQSQPQGATAETDNSVYKSEELGISMDILPGWKMIDKSTDEYYQWDIEKNGDKIEVYIGGLERGWEGCHYENWFTEDSGTVMDVAPTKHSDLTFLKWGFDEHEFIIIAYADHEYFTLSKYTAGPYTKMKDLEPGRYNHCTAEPRPGLALGLYDNTGSDRYKYDSISAYIKSNDPNVYDDIKTMMTSIRPVTDKEEN